MDPLVRPVRQRRRKFNEERRQVIKEETKKLLSVGHIQYPEWLANMVLVKKANGKWRMCVDFTDLNKACPKDSYPLPSIDALVDSASGCKMLDNVHDRAVLLLLHSDALWAEECRRHLPKADGKSARTHDRAKHANLCGRHGGDLTGERSACG